MTNGKIDRNGFLQVERKGVMKRMNCPYSDSNRNCGDWCAHFGEPRPDSTKIFDGRNWCFPSHPDTIVKICSSCWQFSKFTDERESKKE